MSFCSFEVHRVARSSTNEVNLKTISISSLLVLATETIQGKSTRKFHMSLVDPVTLRGSTQRFVLVHLLVRKARSSSYLRPKREIDHVDLISDRLPCDHISEITVPRDHTPVGGVGRRRSRVCELDRTAVHKQRIQRIQRPRPGSTFTARPFLRTLLLACKETHRSCRRTLRYAFAHACI